MVMKYAKITNPLTKAVDVGLGTNEEFYQSIGMVKMEVEESYTGEWYVNGYAPAKPHNIEIKERIDELETSITERNIRSAILGDEYASNKLRAIEQEIAELRKQLESAQEVQ